MGDPSETKDRERDHWMNAVRDRIPAIEDVAKKADAAYQPIVFGRLLEVVIQDARGGWVSPKAAEAPPANRAASAGVETGSGPFARWLGDYAITLESLGNVVDLESGVVLTRNLGSSKADKERRLAALLALVNAHKNGAFYVSREELVRACEEHAAYDTANFARHMKGVEFNGATVFTPEGDGYKVSRPGEAFVADVVKSSLGGGAA